MFFHRHKTKKPWIPVAISDACRNRPDEMIVTTTFLAVYHSGTDQVVIVPIDNPNISNDEAQVLMATRLEQYNRKTKS